jgi:hypothetical protein
MSTKLQSKYFYIKQETTKQCAHSVMATQHWVCEAIIDSES